MIKEEALENAEFLQTNMKKRKKKHHFTHSLSGMLRKHQIGKIYKW